MASASRRLTPGATALVALVASIAGVALARALMGSLARRGPPRRKTISFPIRLSLRKNGKVIYCRDLSETFTVDNTGAFKEQMLEAAGVLHFERFRLYEGVLRDGVVNFGRTIADDEEFHLTVSGFFLIAGNNIVVAVKRL
jgi:hypothetical protein